MGGRERSLQSLSWDFGAFQAWIRGLHKDLKDVNLTASECWNFGDLQFITVDDLLCFGLKNHDLIQSILGAIVKMNHLIYVMETETMQSVVLTAEGQLKTLCSTAVALKQWLLERHKNMKSRIVDQKCHLVMQYKRSEQALQKHLSYVDFWIRKFSSLGSACLKNLQENVHEFCEYMLCVGDPLYWIEASLATIIEKADSLAVKCSAFVEKCSDSLFITPHRLEWVHVRELGKEGGSKLSLETLPNGLLVVESIVDEPFFHLSSKVNIGDAIVQINDQVVLAWMKESVLELLNGLDYNVKILLLHRPEHIDTSALYHQQPRSAIKHCQHYPATIVEHSDASTPNHSSFSQGVIPGSPDVSAHHQKDKSFVIPLHGSMTPNSNTPPIGNKHQRAFSNGTAGIMSMSKAFITPPSESTEDLEPNQLLGVESQTVRHKRRSPLPTVIRMKLQENINKAGSGSQSISLNSSPVMSRSKKQLQLASSTNFLPTHYKPPHQPLRIQSNVSPGIARRKTNKFLKPTDDFTGSESANIAPMVESEISDLSSENEGNQFTFDSASAVHVKNNEKFADAPECVHPVELRQLTLPHQSKINHRISCKDLGRGDCEGWLHIKKSNRFTSFWARRWCVLKKMNFYYYNHKLDPKAEGVFVIPGFIVTPIHKSKKGRYLFRLYNDYVSFTLASDSQRSRTQWMNKLGLQAINVRVTSCEQIAGFTKAYNSMRPLGQFYSESDDEDNFGKYMEGKRSKRNRRDQRKLCAGVPSVTAEDENLQAADCSCQHAPFQSTSDESSEESEPEIKSLRETLKLVERLHALQNQYQVLKATYRRSDFSSASLHELSSETQLMLNAACIPELTDV